MTTCFGSRDNNRGAVDELEKRSCSRICGAERRERLLKIATNLFTSRGLRGTTTAVLAARAGISEPVLYAHFETKDQLFRETVERNIENRLRTLDRRISLISSDSLVGCIELMAETTVGVCVSERANALLMNWALLEVPEYATDLHRSEIGTIQLMWERGLVERYPGSGLLGSVRMCVLPYAIQACVAYGFWLAALRHSPDSAAPVAREFAAGIRITAETLSSSDL
jgi:AcrR family transcriptional regulator